MITDDLLDSATCLFRARLNDSGHEKTADGPADYLSSLWSNLSSPPNVQFTEGGPTAPHPGWGAARDALIGSGIGGALGLGRALFDEDRRKNWLQEALQGALLGGGIGGGVGLTRHALPFLRNPVAGGGDQGSGGSDQTGGGSNRDDLISRGGDEIARWFGVTDPRSASNPGESIIENAGAGVGGGIGGLIGNRTGRAVDSWRHARAMRNQPYQDADARFAEQTAAHNAAADAARQPVPTAWRSGTQSPTALRNQQVIDYLQSEAGRNHFGDSPTGVQQRTNILEGIHANPQQAVDINHPAIAQLPRGVRELFLRDAIAGPAPVHEARPLGRQRVFGLPIGPQIREHTLSPYSEAQVRRPVGGRLFGTIGGGLAGAMLGDAFSGPIYRGTRGQ
jgi:hypothetical protein